MEFKESKELQLRRRMTEYASNYLRVGVRFPCFHCGRSLHISVYFLPVFLQKTAKTCFWRICNLCAFCTKGCRVATMNTCSIRSTVCILKEKIYPVLSAAGGRTVPTSSRASLVLFRTPHSPPSQDMTDPEGTCVQSSRARTAGRLARALAVGMGTALGGFTSPLLQLNL